MLDREHILELVDIVEELNSNMPAELYTDGFYFSMGSDGYNCIFQFSDVPIWSMDDDWDEEAETLEQSITKKLKNYRRKLYIITKNLD